MELRIFFIALILLVGCETQLEDPILEESKSSEGSLLSKAATKGKNILEDGSVYEGDLVRGLPHGFGLRNLVMRISTRGSLRRGWLRSWYHSVQIRPQFGEVCRHVVKWLARRFWYLIFC